MKIQNTLNNYGGNFARPTKYTVMITPPSLLVNTADRAVDILCKSVAIPEVSSEPIEMTFKGHRCKIPGRTNQAQSVTCTFYLDERYDIRRMFQDWIDVMDPKYYARAEVPNTNSEKYGSMLVQARDFTESGQSVEEFNFEKLYPTSIGEIEYSADGKDTIMEITVTFAYYRMISDTFAQSRMDDLDDYAPSYNSQPDEIGEMMRDFGDLSALTKGYRW